MTAVNSAVGFAILTDEEMASHLETQEREHGLPTEAWIASANAYAFKVKGMANLGILEINPLNYRRHLPPLAPRYRGRADRGEQVITAMEVWGALVNHIFGRGYERRYNPETGEYYEGEAIDFTTRHARMIGNVDISPLIRDYGPQTFKGIQIRNYRLGTIRRVMVNKDNEFSITKLREKIAEMETGLERLIAGQEAHRARANTIEAKRKELLREYAPSLVNDIRSNFIAQGNDTYALEIRSLTTQQAKELLTFLEYGYGVDDPRKARLES